MNNDLRLIRKELQFGDVTRIANELGVSKQSVHSALKGELKTDTGEVIISYAKKIINQREERLIELKRIIDKQRLERNNRLNQNQ
jgi:predicted transcriptional regulator